MKKIGLILIGMLAVTGFFLAGCGKENAEEAQGTSSKDSSTTEAVVETAVEKFYFTANEGGSISKINAENNQVIETINAEGVVHNIQLSPDGKIVAATLVPVAEGGHGDHGSHGEETGKVLFYDAYTNELLKTVEVGNHPAHVVYSGDGKLVLVTNNEDNTVSVIDAATYDVIKTIGTGKGPHGFRVSADNKFAYIANMGEESISVIDLETFEENRINAGKTPVTTGITKDGKTLAVTLFAENALAIIDTETKEVVKIEVGRGPAQVYIGPDDKFAYVANQGTKESPSNTISIVDLEAKAVVDEIETGSGAHGVVVSADGKFAYVTNMFDNTVSIIDLESKEVKTIKVGEIPNGITIME
ncbi:YncE family protein [Mesobacillus subterraneus]|uniref:YncE family protein n=1 Tax=Mesobacillus subterraneus TaxID=285983 RepID=A0A427TLD9_9BACI|nr:YncE family protein [Mesobacillus subterraneus]RSD25162.1 YncE family protein [Mesobacillus subterraneus]